MLFVRLQKLTHDKVLAAAFSSIAEVLNISSNYEAAKKIKTTSFKFAFSKRNISAQTINISTNFLKLEKIDDAEPSLEI